MDHRRITQMITMKKNSTQRSMRIWKKSRRAMPKMKRVRGNLWWKLNQIHVTQKMRVAATISKCNLIT